MSAGISAGYDGDAWSHGNWFCGFWVGMPLTGYLHTGDERYLGLAREDGHRGILLHGCYSQPHNIGLDAAVMFGDYFFAEALSRVAFPGRLVPARERVSGMEMGDT